MTMHQDTVGFLAARSPAATRVLSRHGIEFCCYGGRRLDDACAVTGLEPERLVAEVIIEEAADDNSALGWGERPLEDLVRHLVSAYHIPWRADFPRCLALGREVALQYAERDGDRLCALVRVLEALADEFEGHLEREEQVLFPWIAAGRGATAGAPIRVSQTEHRSVIRWLAEIRGLTDNLQAPPASGRDWHALLAGLSVLDAQLREHIHLENNVLFPRALAG
jgi:regulator of cell morphogenesis and NO signaling